MTVSENVIIAEGISHKAREIIRVLEKGGKPAYKVWYAVTTAWGSGNLMYILSSMEYRLPMYHDNSLRLLGLAGSRKEACDIVLEIVKNGYHKDAISDMKQFVERF